MSFKLVKKIKTIIGGIFDIVKRAFQQLISHANSMNMINKYLQSHSVRKLQLAAGGNLLEGWLNTDAFMLTSYFSPINKNLIYLDVTKPFPFEDNTFDYIYSEHLIEHLTYEQGLFMMQECFRVLKKLKKTIKILFTFTFFNRK